MEENRIWPFSGHHGVLDENLKERRKSRFVAIVVVFVVVVVVVVVIVLLQVKERLEEKTESHWMPVQQNQVHQVQRNQDKALV
jgi:flagellar basal body-associated protein FliL